MASYKNDDLIDKGGQVSLHTNFGELVSADIILVRSDPRDVADIIGLAKKTYAKMVQNLLWATGYNTFAIPFAAGVLIGYGILLTPAMGAVLMSASTVIVAVNAKLLRFR